VSETGKRLMCLMLVGVVPREVAASDKFVVGRIPPTHVFPPSLPLSLGGERFFIRL
jgi:hypothetical protein